MAAAVVVGAVFDAPLRSLPVSLPQQEAASLSSSPREVRGEMVSSEKREAARQREEGAKGETDRRHAKGVWGGGEGRG